MCPRGGQSCLARHQLVGIIDTLPEFYSAWEQWAAAVAESHTTYPVLLLFRSPEPWFSWLLGLLAVLDGAAMHVALSPATASSNARLCLRMGFTALDRIGEMLGWYLDPDPLPEAPIDLTYEEFEAAVRMLDEVRLPPGAHRPRGLARFPRVASQLRDSRLPPCRPPRRAPRRLGRGPDGIWAQILWSPDALHIAGRREVSTPWPPAWLGRPQLHGT